MFFGVCFVFFCINVCVILFVIIKVVYFCCIIGYFCSFGIIIGNFKVSCL